MKVPPIIVGVLAIGIVAMGFAHVLHVEPFWMPTSITTATCPAPSTPEWGFPAIHPRHDCSPSFTEQDVRQYVLSTPIGPNLGRVGVATHITIVRVLFTNSHDASILMGEPTGLPDNATVCYVELRGVLTGYATFMPVGVTAPALSRNPPQSTIKVLFDARTGNVLSVSAQ